MRYPSHVAVGTTPDVLWRVREPGINLAIWERPIIPESIRFIRELPAELLPNETCWMSPGAVRGRLRSRFPILGKVAGANTFVDELCMLSEMCNSLAPQPDVRLEFRRGAFNDLGWHEDYGELRIAIVARGPSTQFVGEEDVIRKLGPAPDINVRSDATIYEFPPGAVAALKGTAFPSPSDCPMLIHRPPPPEISSPDRLIIFIEPEAPSMH